MNPKVINSLSARLARLEALLENNDVFKASSGATYGGLNYQGSVFNIEAPGLEQPSGLGFGSGGGFGGMTIDPNDMTIFDLQQRIASLELLASGGSNDTYQGGALDAGAAVGDDGERGSGTSGGVPDGYTEVAITLCVDGVSTPATILARL